MAKADVWMPLFIGDYLADTARLTTEQHGAYLLLILDYWRNGPPPDNAQVLAQIARLTLDAWSIAQAQIKHLFSIEDGVWRHKRIDAEMVAAKENQGKAQAKAKVAADARWGKTPKNAASNAPSMPQEMLEECPSPSPSPLPKKAKSKPKAPAAPSFDVPAELAARGVQDQTASDWLKLRKDKRATVTQTALDAIISEADKAGMSLERALAMCCARGWAGFKADWAAREGGGRPPADSAQQLGKAGQATAANAQRLLEETGDAA